MLVEKKSIFIDKYLNVVIFYDCLSLLFHCKGDALYFHLSGLYLDCE